MAGPTARNYDITQIHQGPGDIWIIGTPPVDSAAPKLTLASDGSPDVVAHPNSICLGMTESGITFTVKQKVTPIGVDQFTAPVDSYLDADEATLEAEVAQQGVALLQNALTTGVYSTVASPGYNMLTFGGISIMPVFAVAAITPKRTGSGLFVVSLLFRVDGEGGIIGLSSRQKKSTHKLQFKGQADITRTAGRNIGVHYETT